MLFFTFTIRTFSAFSFSSDSPGPGCHVMGDGIFPRSTIALWQIWLWYVSLKKRKEKELFDIFPSTVHLNEMNNYIQIQKYTDWPTSILANMAVYFWAGECCSERHPLCNTLCNVLYPSWIIGNAPRAYITLSSVTGGMIYLVSIRGPTLRQMRRLSLNRKVTRMSHQLLYRLQGETCILEGMQWLMEIPGWPCQPF